MSYQILKLLALVFTENYWQKVTFYSFIAVYLHFTSSLVSCLNLLVHAVNSCCIGKRQDCANPAGKMTFDRSSHGCLPAAHRRQQGPVGGHDC